jgi:hypothetical protein
LQPQKQRAVKAIWNRTCSLAAGDVIDKVGLNRFRASLFRGPHPYGSTNDKSMQPPDKIEKHTRDKIHPGDEVWRATGVK